MKLSASRAVALLALALFIIDPEITKALPSSHNAPPNLQNETSPCTCSCQEKDPPPNKKSRLRPQDMQCGDFLISCDGPAICNATAKTGGCHCPTEADLKSRKHLLAFVLSKVMKRKVEPDDVEKAEYQAILKAGRYKNAQTGDITFTIPPE